MFDSQGATSAGPYNGRRWSLDTINTSLNSGFSFGSLRIPKWKHKSRRLSDSVISPEVCSSHTGYFGGKWPKPSFWSRRISRSRSRSGSRSKWSRKRSYVAYAIIKLKTGETKLVNGDDGSGLGEVILQATMSDHRISSYRLIMASTRAILSEDSAGSCGSPGLESALEDVFEEADCPENFLDPEGMLTEIDTRMEILQEILSTEKTYCKLLGSILNTYAEPLRKFSSLTVDDHRILFVGIEPVLSISAMLTSKLEDALKCWDPASTQIGNLFSSKLWNHYEEYCHNHAKTKQLLEEKSRTEESFLEFCNLRRGKSEQSLADLVYLPVQRIPEYDRYLNDLLDETDSTHPDYDDLNRAALRVRKMVRENEEEFGTSPENRRMDSIQKRFPNDDLQLRETSTAAQKLRSLSARRRSAPGAVLFKTLGNRSKSSGNLLSHGLMGKKEMDIVNPLRQQNSVNRQYLMEGQVEFTKSVQIHDRYLFLFNDLLLVAKQKTSTTFKLKNRVRICEMWIADCISDVAEIPRPSERSTVIGWPTTNVVVTFKSAESKQLWVNKLAEQIEEEREKESHFTQMKLKVVSREFEQAYTLEIDSKMEAREVLKKCLDHFQISESECGDYQLWVKSGKEDTPYPLVGHEVPFNIKMSHVRDICLTRTDEPIIPADYDRVLEEAPNDMKCQFNLKHNKKSPKKSFDDNIGKGFKKSKKSPLMNFFRRNKDDKNNNLTPPGKLFGHPLDDVVTENGLPKSVMEMLRILFRDGPHTVGIFRKSANARKQKELRQKLDDDESFIIDDVEFPPLVIGAVLKEYLRSLPHCLLMEEFYDQWVQLTEETDSPQKLAQVKQLLFKLPMYHIDLLRHLMCVLHHISKNNTKNLMNAYNLAVCIAPSILWSKVQNDPLKTLATAQNPHSIVSYLVDHCAEVFGEETLWLLGDPCDLKLRQDSSTDSDSMHSVLSMPDSSSGGTNRRDDSSIDSLEREMYIGDMDSSPNLAKSHLSPSNLSRDSGLMMSDGQLNEDDNSSVEMLDTCRKGAYPRSISQYMDSDKGHSSSFDSYCSYDPKPPPRKNKRKENVDHSPCMERHQLLFTRGGNRVIDNSRPMLSQSLSVDAFSRLESSAESLKSIEENSNSASAEWQRKHFESTTLHKSASGKHLYIADPSSHYVTEIDIQKSNRDKLVRQASVTSTPPMSPQSKYSYISESMDSVLTDSTGSYLPRQYSRETDFSEKSGSWVSEDSSDFYHLRRSHEDSLVDFNSSTNSFNQSQKNNLLNSSQNVKYPGSPSSHNNLVGSPYNNNMHTPVAARRSFPLQEVVSSKGSGGSAVSKEAEDIISSPKMTFSLYPSEDSIPRPKSTEPTLTTLPHRNSQSTTALDSFNVNNNHMPLKQITKYSAGLGSSSKTRVIVNRNQRSPQKRESNPMRASHDSAIVSQVRKSSLDSSSEMRQNDSISYPESPSGKHHRLMGGSPYALTRSESDSEINRTLTNSPDKTRPDQPPCYEQTLQRQHMMTMGIPLQISEEEKKQKEASALAKKLYENSIKKYMEDHLNSPSVQKCLSPNTPPRDIVISSVDSDNEIEEDENENEEEGIYCELQKPEKDPKLLYEASRKAYEQSVSGERLSRKSPTVEKNLAVPLCNLHRSVSDSAEHLNKRNSWNRRSPSRERSPLAQELISQQGHSPVNNNIKLTYSSSSVSNSSSDTVTESQSPLSHSCERSESSPIISRHVFPKADSPSFSKQYTPQHSPQQRNRDMSSVQQTQKIQQPARSLSRESSFGSKSSSDGQKEVSRITMPRRLSNELAQVQISPRDPVLRKSSTPEPLLMVSRDSPRESSNHSAYRDTSKSLDTSLGTNKTRNQQNVKKDAYSRDLPWSVKELRSMWDHKRPAPPPYQNPPPFRRLVDNSRASMSSNSSASSSRSGRSTPPPQRPLSVHARFGGGPQRGDSFSSAEDSDSCSRYSGCRDTTSSSSEELSQWSHNFTDVTYV